MYGGKDHAKHVKKLPETPFPSPERIVSKRKSDTKIEMQACYVENGYTYRHQGVHPTMTLVKILIEEPTK